MKIFLKFGRGGGDGSWPISLKKEPALLRDY